MEEVNFIIQNKRKRNRCGGSHRWTEKQAISLLDGVLKALEEDPSCFEKATSERFYTRIAEQSPILRDIAWRIMKSKMRHLKASYIAALKWKVETGEDKGVTKRILRICPHFEKLQRIYGEVEIRSPKPYDNDSNEALENPLQINGIMKQELATGEYSSIEDSTHFDNNMFDMSVVQDSSMETSRKKELIRMNESEKALELKIKQFEFEREMAEQELDLKKAKMEQDMEIARMHIEKEERLMQMKLESEERIQKLKLESEERIKKLEIELKLKHNT